MHRLILLAGLALLFVLPAAAGPADVTVEVKDGAKPATLHARLHTPAGQGPFPALIFMHGCGGTGRRQDVWADELRGEGYVVLELDSFGGRGLKRVCGDRTLFPPQDRAGDVFAAVRMLQQRPEVDRARIGLIGWSHGGSPTLWALTARRC